MDEVLNECSNFKQSIYRRKEKELKGGTSDICVEKGGELAISAKG